MLTLLEKEPVVAFSIAPEIFALPSKERPQIVLEVFNAVAVSALPVKSPYKYVAQIFQNL